MIIDRFNVNIIACNDCTRANVMYLHLSANKHTYRSTGSPDLLRFRYLWVFFCLCLFNLAGHSCLFVCHFDLRSKYHQNTSIQVLVRMYCLRECGSSRLRHRFTFASLLLILTTLTS